MKKPSAQKYAAALYQITDGCSDAETKKIVGAFVRILAKRRQIKLFDRVVSEFDKYARKCSGIKNINIITARKINPEILKKIKSVFGEKVEATQETDPSIIGGIKIFTEDLILDASLPAQIKRLRQKLN